MLGLLVQLVLSWLVLRWFDGSNLSALGLIPSRRRLLDFLLFFMVSAAFCVSGFGLKMLIAHQQWRWNTSLSVMGILDGMRWTVVSVLYEELIFRGALLYILIRRLGPSRSVWISAAAFGVYHWFSHGTFGNPSAMAVTFVITGAMGLVQAYGFAKTSSMVAPTAIHLGWNLVQQNVFSSGPIGNQLLVEVPPRPEVTISYAAFWMMQLFSVVGVLASAFWLLYRRK